MGGPRKCPSCGVSLSFDDSDDSQSLIFASQASQTIEFMVPVTFCGDEHGGIPAERHSPRTAAAETETDRAVLCHPEELTSNGSGEYDPLASPVADPLLDVFAEERPDPQKVEPQTPLPLEPAALSLVETEDEPGGTPWSTILLASYASAMTIAVAWLLWQGKGHSTEPPAVDTLPVPAKIVSETERKALPTIPADRHITLGKTLTIGSIEVTPFAFSSGSISQVFAKADGGKARADSPQCLILKVRIKNISKTDSFAPLDPTFVRQTDAGAAESIIQIGETTIESYPLTVGSEIEISGQSFAVLKPGETAETILASEPFSRGSLTYAALWRVPLRVAPATRMTIGVDLTPGDLH